MSAGAAAPEHRPRLNPFAFPSDTAFRFGLLVAAVVGANLYVWQWIAAARGTRHKEDVAGTFACLDLLAGRRDEHRAVHGALTDAFSTCVAQLYRYQVWWMLGGTAALLLAAAAIMLATPLWITRRRKLQPLTGRGRAGRGRGGRGARARAGPRAAAAATGTHSTRRREVSRSGTRAATASRSAAGSSSSRRSTRPRSGPSSATSSRTSATATSGSRTSRSRSGTRSCSSRWSPSSSRCWARDLLSNVIWRLAVLALLVYLTRNAVLRSREVYADLRASVPDGPAGALRRVLAALPRPKTDPSDTRPEPASRSRATARCSRRHAAALPPRRRRRVRRRPDRDDRVRQRQAASLELRGRPVRPVLPRRARPGAARRGRRRRRDLAGGVRGPRGRPHSPRRPGATRSRSPPDSHSARSSRSTGSSRPRGARCCGSSTASTGCSGPRCSSPGSSSSSPGSGRARPGGFAHSAAGGRCSRRRSGLLVGGVALTRVHGHLLDRPRAAGQPRDLARCVVRRASAGRRAGLGGSGAGLAVRDGRRAARDRAEALLRARARAARPLPVRGGTRPPRPARRAWAFLDPGGRLQTPPLGAPPAPAAGDRRAGRPRLPRPRRAHPALHALRRQRRDACDGRHAPVVLRLDGRARDPRPARRRRRGQRGTAVSSGRSARHSSPAASAGSASSAARPPVAA